jgi:dTDP-4-dehydrorhamnose reductase
MKSRSAGLFHLGSSEKISKYEFGMEIAQRFGFSGSLIRPLSLAEANLKVERGKDLSLLTDKFEASFSSAVPELSTGLDRFYELYQQGYPQKLQDLTQHASQGVLK